MGKSIRWPTGIVRTESSIPRLIFKTTSGEGGLELSIKRRKRNGTNIGGDEPKEGVEGDAGIAVRRE